MVRLRNGEFVWTLDQNGIGRLVDSDEEQATVRFFRSPSRTFDLVYPAQQIRRAYLSPQTRVYVESGAGHWMVGRVVDYFVGSTLDGGGQIAYDIQFPNRLSHRIPERHLHVRCLLPVDDPAAILANGGMETQYFFDARQGALECITNSRAAGHGLTGLLSASVELLPHQIQVVRRILQDPIQRYLLADEVGLGKTIEAGAIVRQAVIDNPTERVGILVPATLLGQWVRELRDRFFLTSSNVTILTHEELKQLVPGEVDSLVIDEAHHLIPENAWANEEYRHLEELTRLASRVLLISATPTLGDEDLLLALLHLLDPTGYPFEARDEFADRVRRRQEYGRLLLALSPSLPAPFLLNTLAKIRSAFPDD